MPDLSDIFLLASRSPRLDALFTLSILVCIFIGLLLFSAALVNLVRWVNDRNPRVPRLPRHERRPELDEHDPHYKVVE